MGMAVFAFMLALGLAVLLLSPVAAQNCGCPDDLCCSQYGICSSGDAYCGTGCQAGACNGVSGSGGVGGIVTDAFFNGIKSQSSGSCAGQSYYTRRAFLNAAGSGAYSSFGSGSSDAAIREIAAFFAHVTHDTGYFCYIKNPQTMAQDPVNSFKMALWFWTTNVHGVLSQGFGATIRAINGAVECDGKNTTKMNDRVALYQKYCNQLGVNPGGNLTC